MKLQPVILSGGSGTRLWPMSREYYPKQLLALNGEHSMLQETLKRLAGLQNETLAIAEPIIICNEEHRFLVAEQARQANISLDKIILEPFGRNTAPALTLAALALTAAEATAPESTAPATGGQQQDAVMLIMPADHLVKDVAAFHDAVRLGYELACADQLVTFGIVPTQAETGYGYIRKGKLLASEKNQAANSPSLGHNPYSIAAFVEKPDAATAQSYVDSGDYLWNSGMFMMKASVWQQAISHYRQDMMQACRQAYAGGKPDIDFYRIDKAAFDRCPSDSIDYAVMEKLTDSAAADYKAAVIPLDAGWSDIGSWSSLWEASEADAQGNVIGGDVYAYDSRNNLLLSEHRLLATVGVEDLIVVETSDAVLVAHKSQAQQVKQIVERIKAEDRSEHLFHRRVHRPWGNYEGIDTGDRFQVKRITVNPGSTLSLQMHHHRAEHWVVVRGTARVTKGEEVFLLSENESTYIPIGITHRLENPGTLPLEIIEVQSGSYLGEDDIVRFEDVYGREEGK